MIETQPLLLGSQLPGLANCQFENRDTSRGSFSTNVNQLLAGTDKKGALDGSNAVDPILSNIDVVLRDLVQLRSGTHDNRDSIFRKEIHAI